MAKSIRSKIMKKHRAVMRSTVGSAQAQKHLRQTMRRLNASLGVQRAAKEAAAGGTGDVEMLAASGAPSLAALGSAIAGAGTAGVAAATGAADAAGRSRLKKLRHTFNTGLREMRVAGDLEDLTDDEEEVRTADKRYMGAGLLDAMAREAGGAAGAADDAVDGADDAADAAEVEEYGVTKAAGRTRRKRVKGGDRTVPAIDGAIGMYDTDPILRRGYKPKAEVPLETRLLQKLSGARVSRGVRFVRKSKGGRKQHHG